MHSFQFSAVFESTTIAYRRIINPLRLRLYRRLWLYYSRQFIHLLVSIIIIWLIYLISVLLHSHEGLEIQLYLHLKLMPFQCKIRLLDRQIWDKAIVKNFRFANHRISDTSFFKSFGLFVILFTSRKLIESDKLNYLMLL